MQTVTIKELFRNPPQAPTEARVNGWIRTLRDGKDFAFIELNDGTHFRNLQVVADANALSGYKDIVKLPEGSSVTCAGTLVPTPEAKQPFELKAASIKAVGVADRDYPLQKKRHSFEYLRTIAHLRPRTNTFNAVFRVRSVAAYAIHKFFNERGFVYVHTPLITGSDCEGAGEMFRVTTLDMGNLPRTPDGSVDVSQDFFGKQTNLTVSGQLNVEPFCMAFHDVYTFGPTFRAENSNTQRHAAEFWMIEPEIAFADLDDVMALAEDMTRAIISDVLTQVPDEMAFFNTHIDKTLIDRLTHTRDAGFKRVTYTDAIEILKQSGKQFEFEPYWGCDLQTEHERYLTEQHFGAPVFVTHYPKEIKSFYMRLDDGERTVAAADLLVAGIGELIGGSQREERYDTLLARIDELGLMREDYEWYLDTRRYGTVPHGGFGIGFERLIMFLTGVTNIRDVLPYPRTPNNAEF